jgi:hypothetical protein
MRAMLAQMREAPAEQVLVEVINVLLQAVQVKLGRRDARLLIDAVAAITTATDGRVDATLQGQIAQALTQLRLAQVEAERQEGIAEERVAPAAAAGPGATPPAPAPSPQASPAPGAPAASRLWVPGR